MGSAASASGARTAGARRPLAEDICPGSQPGGERAGCAGQALRPGAAGARARGGRLPSHCAPADFHGRLPRSRRRRPGAGLSPGFKRHSRNVNNPGGSAPGRPARAPHPSPRDSPTAGPPGPPPLPAENFFFLRFSYHLAPPAGHGARATPRARAQGAWHQVRDPGGLAARPLFGRPESRLRPPRSRQLPGPAVPESWGSKSLLARLPSSLPPAAPSPALPLLLSPDCFSNALT